MFLFNMVEVKLVIRKSLPNRILEKMSKKKKEKEVRVDMEKDRIERKNRDRREEVRMRELREKEGFLM